MLVKDLVKYIPDQYNIEIYPTEGGAKFYNSNQVSKQYGEMEVTTVFPRGESIIIYTNGYKGGFGK